VRERHDAHLIQTVMLRSLKQAMYGADNLGHFGLAFEAYAHFTSPIRRYPDLLVHRAIRHILAGRKVSEFHYATSDMDALGDHCSITERRADEATRDAVDWLKCEFMLDKLGSEYEGIITSVTNFGLFVELSDIYVEGLVHVTALKQDYYHFDPVHHRLIGERTNRMYRLADPVRVIVSRVDLDERKIDFELADSQPAGEQPAAGRKGRARQAKGKGKQLGGKKTGKKTTKKQAAKSSGGKKMTASKASTDKPAGKKKARRRRR